MCSLINDQVTAFFKCLVNSGAGGHFSNSSATHATQAPEGTQCICWEHVENTLVSNWIRHKQPVLSSLLFSSFGCRAVSVLITVKTKQKYSMYYKKMLKLGRSMTLQTSSSTLARFWSKLVGGAQREHARRGVLPLRAVSFFS